MAIVKKLARLESCNENQSEEKICQLSEIMQSENETQWQQCESCKIELNPWKAIENERNG